jgi:teichoic acid transport system ATP-binding protein
VSHELNSVREICQRAMWLDHGRIKMIGPTDEVAGAYEASVRPG